MVLPSRPIAYATFTLRIFAYASLYSYSCTYVRYLDCRHTDYEIFCTHDSVASYSLGIILVTHMYRQLKPVSMQPYYHVVSAMWMGA